MQKIVSFIPNLFTLGNLFCGCLAIIFAFDWKLDWAAYMVFLAAFLDFFDGFLARILKVQSELGKQLDSLADMVSFGVVPGIIMFQWLRYIGWIENVIETQDISFLDIYLKDNKYAYLALLIPIFSCYRLAKFNIDTRQSQGFIGLPTPANAIFFCSIPLIAQFNLTDYLSDIFTPWNVGEYVSTSTRFEVNETNYLQKIATCLMERKLVVSFIILFAYLLVSPLPIFALKFKNFGWTDNKIRYIFLALSVILLILFQVIAVPFIVILYIVLSIVNNIFKLTV